MNRQARRHQPAKVKPKINVSTMISREIDLRKDFKKETGEIIKDTCTMYSIALAMVLADKYHQTGDQITAVLSAVEKLSIEFLEDRLSIGDCRRALIEDLDLYIGDENTYKQLETC